MDFLAHTACSSRRSRLSLQGNRVKAFGVSCHCEERSGAAIPIAVQYGMEIGSPAFAS
jgi:hypothetical protein